MINKYLIRLDDACPTMDANKWQKIENILAAYGVRPMVGVIPANEDPKQQIDAADTEFWAKVKTWEKKGWAIALHGYDHCYISNDGLYGLNPLWARSEFAGVPLNEQKIKIREGIKVFNSHNISTKYFFAPSHTFDENTLVALREESNIRIISDTIATKPYKFKDFIFIPQLGGRCIDIKVPGFWTFCLHPSTMNEEQFVAVETFLQEHKEKFISFDDLTFSGIKGKSIWNKLFSWGYFFSRKIRGLR